MNDLQIPKKWPEKLRELALNGAEEVTNKSTVYAAIIGLKNSGDKEHNFKEFTIRIDPESQVEYCWRVK